MGQGGDGSRQDPAGTPWSAGDHGGMDDPGLCCRYLSYDNIKKHKSR